MNTAMRALRALEDLAHLASLGESTYEIIPYAFGFMLCKDGKNLTAEIGEGFVTISRYLLNVIEGEQQ
jgi:hypothetical protein